MKTLASEGLMAPSGSLEQDAPAALPAYAATIGIDWGDQKQYYTLRPAHEPGKLQRGSFATAQLGQWVLDLRQRFSHGRIAVALEHGRSALLYALMEQTDFIDLYLIAPKASASYREAFASSGAKADNTDADAIEDMLCHHRGQLRRWQPEDAATRLLEALCRQRRHAVEERTALSNQLVAQLKLCYPVALELSREVANPMLLELLQRWPTLAKLRAAKPSTLKSFFYLHHVRRPKCIERRLELIAQAGTLVHDAAILLAAQLEVRRLVGQLRALLPSSPTTTGASQSFMKLMPMLPSSKACRGLVPPSDRACYAPWERCASAGLMPRAFKSSAAWHPCAKRVGNPIGCSSAVPAPSTCAKASRSSRPPPSSSALGPGNSMSVSWPLAKAITRQCAP
jgi:hypothetical protein